MRISLACPNLITETRKVSQSFFVNSDGLSIVFSQFGNRSDFLEYFSRMSNREIVIDLLSRLPEDASLEEIALEIELLAGIKVAREQAARSEGIPAEDARKLIDTWAGQLF